jgi:hypothetical protein
VIGDDQRNRSGVFQATPRGSVPPLVTTPFICEDQGNANPRFIRSTMYNIPFSNDMMKQSHVPFALSIMPFAKLNPKEVRVYSMISQTPNLIHLLYAWHRLLLLWWTWVSLVLCGAIVAKRTCVHTCSSLMADGDSNVHSVDAALKVRHILVGSPTIHSIHIFNFLCSAAGIFCPS